MSIVRPTLLLDEQKCRMNIRRMVEKANRHDLKLRPHFKTHQSQTIGEWFRQEGVNQITVSSVAMAEYFAKANWNDITVAFPLNAHEYEKINSITQSCNLNLIVVNTEALEQLVVKLKNPVGIFIEVDSGDHRTGVGPADDTLIDSILNLIQQNDLLTFKGFLTHAGHSYKARSQSEIEAIHAASLREMNALRNRYIINYPDLIISIGDTPSCSVVEDFTGVDEIRAGNFVFYDLTQCAIGSCREDNIAIAMACPIVAINDSRNELVIHGGGVHFSKDFLKDVDGSILFGKVVELENGKWGKSLEGVFIKSLSQEHGVVHVPSDIIKTFKVGDIIGVLPVHSCLTADAMGEYYLENGDVITMM